MAGMILEGGTFRPIFSCGAMDALLAHDIHFPYVIGVSAGISDGVSYVSRQKGRNLEILLRYRNDKRYVGLRNFLTCGSLFGMDFIYREIPETYVPFDFRTFYAAPETVLAGVTNARTGEAEYWDCKKTDQDFTLLRATCALPLLFPAIEMGGQPYYDGGLRDPIPIRKAMADGQEKNLILLTRPAGYRKGLSRQNRLAARVLRKKYPALEPVLLTRHEAYNETVRFCEQLEAEGRAVVLRPDRPLDSMEKDLSNIRRAYEDGWRMAEARLEEIRALLAP